MTKKDIVALLVLMLMLVAPQVGCGPKTISVSGPGLRGTEVTLSVGRSVKLSATLSPASLTTKPTDLFWVSSDEGIAVVDSGGLVTATGVGIATITVTTTDRGKLGTCVIRVEPVRVTAVLLSHTNLEIGGNEVVHLTATVTPPEATNKNVFWKSSDDNVVTVTSQGVVMARSDGKASITASTEDGGLEASCLVYATTSVNTVGNTQGSLVNSGLVAHQGDWVYYANRADGYRLYKVRIDSTERTQLNDDRSVYINVVGDWVYYGNGSGLYRIRTDGTERTKLSDDWSRYINVVGDWVYYQNFTLRLDHDTLYKIRTDGTERTKLDENGSSYIAVAGDWIYYSSSSDSNRLYRIRTDGTDRTKLNEFSSVYINVVGDWVYYGTTGEGGTLYKSRIDGTEHVELIHGVRCINVVGDWLYYYLLPEHSGEGGIYKIRTDGTGRTKLSDDSTLSVYVIGDWVYYECWSDGEQLYRIRSDGTARQRVD